MSDVVVLLVIDNQIFINEIMSGFFVPLNRDNNVNFADILSKGS